MKQTHRYLLAGVLLLACLCVSPYTQAAENGGKARLLLAKGDRLVVTGDSITESMCYIRYLELYLTACKPELEVTVMHVGRSGANLGAMQIWTPLILLPFKPQLVTLCFGMNDGAYVAPNRGTVEGYAKNLQGVIGPLHDAGTTVLIASPGVVDSHYFTALRSPCNPGEAATIYNSTLAGLRDAARDVAAANQLPFADIHDTMFSVMRKAKATLGSEYSICPDGIHPSANGHLIMAYVLLTAMGVDGNIGEIVVDMNGTATASEGHRVLSADKGTVQLESTRYPFCFNGDEKSASGTRSILPFLPFNRDLNRFTLVVKNLPGEKARVTWGTATRSLTDHELQAGVNLADVFADDNPFKANFQQADAAILAKETYETRIKEVIAIVATQLKTPEDQTQVNALRALLFSGVEKKGRDIRAILTPVKHTLTIVPE
jgi:lysophospholipase L1-like esterase